MARYEWPVERKMRLAREKANHQAVQRMMDDSAAAYPAWKAKFIAARAEGHDIDTATAMASA